MELPDHILRLGSVRNISLVVSLVGTFLDLLMCWEAEKRVWMWESPGLAGLASDSLWVMKAIKPTVTLTCQSGVVYLQLWQYASLTDIKVVNTISTSSQVAIRIYTFAAATQLVRVRVSHFTVQREQCRILCKWQVQGLKFMADLWGRGVPDIGQPRPTICKFHVHTVQRTWLFISFRLPTWRRCIYLLFWGLCIEV